MQVTIRVSEDELEWLCHHLQMVILMDSTGMKHITVGDKILDRVYTALRATTTDVQEEGGSCEPDAA